MSIYSFVRRLLDYYKYCVVQIRLLLKKYFTILFYWKKSIVFQFENLHLFFFNCDMKWSCFSILIRIFLLYYYFLWKFLNNSCFAKVLNRGLILINWNVDLYAVHKICVINCYFFYCIVYQSINFYFILLCVNLMSWSFFMTNFISFFYVV